MSESRPLSGYAMLLGFYGLTALGFLAVCRRRSNRSEPLPTSGDVALLGAATFKLARLATKAQVTAPLRAPFARYVEPSGEGEANEEPRGTGLRQAIGELVTCPFCFSTWVATGLSFGLVLAPRATRLIMATFAAVAVSDLLHLGFSSAAQVTERLEDA